MVCLNSWLYMIEKEASSFNMFKRGENVNLEVKKELLRRHGIIEMVKLHLERSRERMKSQANKHKQDIEFDGLIGCS